MKIKKRKVETKQERSMLIGLITNDTFLKEIRPIFNNEYITSPFVKTITRWVFDYYDKYEKAPGKTIQDIYTAKMKAGETVDEQEELIESFLESISEEYVEEDFDAFFNIDETERYFRTRKAELIINQAKYHLSEGEVDKAEHAISNFSKVSRAGGSGIDIINDLHVIKEVTNFQKHEMFKLVGTIGDILGPFERGDLFAVAAPPKRGKTWWLVEGAVTATWQRLKVLFISLEMIERQVLRRFYQKFTSEPKKGGKIKIPYFDRAGEIDFKTVEKEGLTTDSIRKKLKSITPMMRQGGIRVICYPSYSANVEDIELDLHNLENYEGFVPDVIVVDYADILAPERDAPKDYRHRLDQTWKKLRGLAQKINGLVITATQTTRRTFKKDVGQEDIAEDMRKIAHVATMIAINQKEEDRDKSAVRVKVLAHRHEDFNLSKDIQVLQSLAIGCPLIDSRILEKEKN